MKPPPRPPGGATRMTILFDDLCLIRHHSSASVPPAAGSSSRSLAGPPSLSPIMALALTSDVMATSIFLSAIHAARIAGVRYRCTRRKSAVSSATYICLVRSSALQEFDTPDPSRRTAQKVEQGDPDFCQSLHSKGDLRHP